MRVGLGTAVLVALFFASASALARFFLRVMKHTITGDLKPLVPPGGQLDAASRTPVAFVSGTDPNANPPAEQFVQYRGTSCEIHGKPYNALTVFRLIEPTDRGFWSPHLEVVGRCFLLSCADCVAEAHRWAAFAWRRDNQPEHPSWASAALYPFLLKERYFELDDGVVRPYWDVTEAAPNAT